MVMTASGKHSRRARGVHSEKYRIGRTDADEAFAVEKNGPNVANIFRGGARCSALHAGPQVPREVCGRTPNSTALADALTLSGPAKRMRQSGPEPVYLRVAEHAKEHRH